MVRIFSHVGGAEQLRLPDDLVSRVEVVSSPMGEPLPEGLLGDVLVSIPRRADLRGALARGVRWVHFIGTGIDSIPVEQLDERCVFTNSPGVSAVPISEWVLACMLAFEKRLPESWIHERPSRWYAPASPLGTLHGRTLALVGLGGIGTAVATRALAFGMRVKALRRRPEPSHIAGVEIVASPEELVAQADHVVVVAPLTDATRGLIDRDVFAAMAPGVHLVNVARGPIVVTDDLREALDGGIVGCASLDVTDPEPLPDGHWLYQHPRVRLSAHVSWSWPLSDDAIGDMFSANLRRFLDGQPLVSVIERDLGY